MVVAPPPHPGWQVPVIVDSRTVVTHWSRQKSKNDPFLGGMTTIVFSIRPKQHGRSSFVRPPPPPPHMPSCFSRRQTRRCASFCQKDDDSESFAHFGGFVTLVVVVGQRKKWVRPLVVATTARPDNLNVVTPKKTKMLTPTWHVREEFVCVCVCVPGIKSMYVGQTLNELSNNNYNNKRQRMMTTMLW